MEALIFVFILLLLAGLAIVPSLFSRSRRSAREDKDYERGLKLVPLLIHLPPPSDDTDTNGRDVREINDENISKAQIIYNIVASTFQKGWKSRRYGQRHFSFEIVGMQGRVYFYAAVPVSMVDVVKQAIVSAYPSARLEEVDNHNIFSKVGKVNATTGGELALKESFAFPIATYQDLKRDAMQSILNALSTLSKEDGAGIQILMRPADPSWRKTVHEKASGKRKGEDKKSGAEKYLAWARQVAIAFVKAPEEDKKKEHELSSLDQSIVDSMEDKTRHPGYEVLIRIVASSNISQRAQSILGNVVAAFAVFDAQGKNGFKFELAKDTEKLAASYILRLFPQQVNDNILNAVELATIFHFPDQRSIPTSQLERQGSKQVDGPRNVPDDGLLLGYNIFRGVKKPIRLDANDRQRHMYVVGQTGTGKSTFLENLALQDMLKGNGFAFVDPHGDTAEKLLSMVPRERTEDITYFSPADVDYPMGLNLFEFHTADQKDFLIQEVLNMLYKLYDPQHQGIMGPRYEDMFRNAALVVMADPDGGTFIDIPKLFRDPQFLKQKLQHVKDQTVLDFWQKQFPASQRSNEAGEVTAWFVSKFGAFLSNEMMRNIIGQTKSAFDLRSIMDNKKILLVNLSKGRTGDLNSKLLGMIFVMKFQAAAMSRADILEKDRVDFSLYVDEFQNFSTDSFATILSEARKYHLNLIVANQYTKQLSDEIRDAVFGNVGTLISFRVGNDDDADVLARRMQPGFDASDLLRMPNFNTAARTMIGGVPTQPFSMSTLPPLGTPNPKLASALKQLSAAKFGHPRLEVEKNIFERLATKQLPPGPGGMGPPARPGGHAAPWGAAPAGALPPQRPYGYPGAPLPPAPQSGGSFLDEWLVKRKNPAPAMSGTGPRPAGGQPSRYNSPAQTAPSSMFQPYGSSPAAGGAYHRTVQSKPNMPKGHTDQPHRKNTQEAGLGDLTPGGTVKVDRSKKQANE